MANFKEVFDRHVKATCDSCLASERFSNLSDTEVTKKLQAKGWVKIKYLNQEYVICGGCYETYKRDPEKFCARFLPTDLSDRRK